MNKQELIDAVAGRTGDTKAATGDAIDAVLAAIMRTLITGDAVQLIGFGSFSTGSAPHAPDAIRRRAPKCRLPRHGRSSSRPARRSRMPSTRHDEGGNRAR